MIIMLILFILLICAAAFAILHMRNRAKPDAIDNVPIERKKATSTFIPKKKVIKDGILPLESSLSNNEKIIAPACKQTPGLQSSNCASTIPPVLMNSVGSGGSKSFNLK